MRWPFYRMESSTFFFLVLTVHLLQYSTSVCVCVCISICVCVCLKLLYITLLHTSMIWMSLPPSLLLFAFAVANSGRVDRMFQVTPDQENNLFIGDMLSDGLLIVELPPTTVATPIQPPLLISSMPEEAEAGSDLDSPAFGSGANASSRRKSFGRNASYGMCDVVYMLIPILFR